MFDYDKVKRKNMIYLFSRTFFLISWTYITCDSRKEKILPWVMSTEHGKEREIAFSVFFFFSIELSMNCQTIADDRSIIEQNVNLKLGVSRVNTMNLQCKSWLKAWQLFVSSESELFICKHNGRKFRLSWINQRYFDEIDRIKAKISDR